MKILVLIQNETNREMITQSLTTCGHHLVEISTAKGAFDLLETDKFPVAIIDIEHEILEDEPLSTQLTRHYPDTEVIITTTSLTALSEAVTALRNGGYSFLVKTFEDVGLISATLNRAIDNVRILSELQARFAELQEKNSELSGLNKTLQNLEVRDALTGLRGQLQFHESLGKELIRSLQNKSPFSLLLMTVRFFASGDDESQPLADERIAQLSQALKERLRRSDLITFYREQTFGLLLPETSKDACRYVRSNLVEMLKHFPFATTQSCEPSTVIAYFGQSSFPDDGSSISSLILEAEKGLKLSKESGGMSIGRLDVNNQGQGIPLIDALSAEEKPRRRVLVVDDEPSICSLVSLMLTDNDFEVSIAENGEDALAQFQEDPFPVVISDVMMPGMSGMELLTQIKDIQPEVEVVIMTSQSNVTSSIDAMRAGAFDFLPKPIEDLNIIPIIANRAFENFFRVNEKQRLIAELERKNKGLAIANKTLKEMVILDGLTGLFNHSHFKESVEIEISRSKRHQRQFTVLFIDLDNFKQYNDNHGHPAGDQLLKTLATLIGSRLRKSDTLARYGGDEFTAILPETAKVDALRIAEGIRKEVQNYPFPGRDVLPAGRVSITVGVATFPEDGDATDVLIISADQALYQGKNQGRNCIST